MEQNQNLVVLAPKGVVSVSLLWVRHLCLKNLRWIMVVNLLFVGGWNRTKISILDKLEVLLKKRDSPRLVFVKMQFSDILKLKINWENLIISSLIKIWKMSNQLQEQQFLDKLKDFQKVRKRFRQLRLKSKDLDLRLR